ncbi:hypothetical protein [Roseovarius mucosus]
MTKKERIIDMTANVLASVLCGIGFGFGLYIALTIAGYFFGEGGR